MPDIPTLPAACWKCGTLFNYSRHQLYLRRVWLGHVWAVDCPECESVIVQGSEAVEQLEAAEKRMEMEMRQ